jgi:hypothetical protein
MNAIPEDWPTANQRCLITALDGIRSELQRHATRRGRRESERDDPCLRSEPLWHDLGQGMAGPSALESLGVLFSLSPFEKGLLIMCAGMELDDGWAACCAEAHGDARKAYPTFGLALAALPGAHWSAVTPAGPLRYWRLIEIESGTTMMSSPLRIDEHILNFLAGTAHLDERLTGFVQPLNGALELVPSHEHLTEQIKRLWMSETLRPPFSVVRLKGPDARTNLAVAVGACTSTGLQPYQLSCQVLPRNPAELEVLARLWNREAALSGCALLMDCHDFDCNDAVRKTVAAQFIALCSGPLIIGSHEQGPVVRRPLVTLEVKKPRPLEQRSIWLQTVGAAAAHLEADIDSLVAQFNLSASSIREVSAAALGTLREDRVDKQNSESSGGASRAAASENPGATFSADAGALLWRACRTHTRPNPGGLARAVKPRADWDDLVLPRAQKDMLHQIAWHVRQRNKVYETWGFAKKYARGLGISALFSGSSGTGKTMAAEVLANKLKLDLYLVDLSQVVSKYIGETEKNLARVFDAAEEGGAILLFDEADALFGKRSVVKDSHDRYANIEISYLLQRMEAYRGLAILTTNMKDALDAAFLRRIRFIVQFPFPDASERAMIWERVFPADTPTGTLDLRKLAQLNISGGSIRNIAMNAAFAAAHEDVPVTMGHILQAIRVEYVKMDKPLGKINSEEWI